MALELLAHFLLERLDFGELRLDIGALLQQAALVRFQHGEKALQLRSLVASGLVHVDELADLGQAEAQALAAQRELEAGAGPPRGDAPPAPPAPRRPAPGPPTAGPPPPGRPTLPP